MLADLLRLQLDLVGARADLAAALLGSAALRRIAPVARQPIPVLTIPGFLASDVSLMRLNRFLNAQGFQARSWGLGRNLGSRGEDWSDHLAALEANVSGRIKMLADECSAPVALVGQSLGGVYARELALRMEDEIDRVIMLGAPTFHPYKANRHNRVVGAVGYWMSRRNAAEFAGQGGLLHWDSERPAMPCVAVHSPVDMIVDEQACHIPGYVLDQSGPAAPRENIRVLSSHLGMAVSPWVQLALADRLLCPSDKWQPFEPRDYFSTAMTPLLEIMYPRADRLWRNRGTAAFVGTEP